MKIIPIACALALTAILLLPSSRAAENEEKREDAVLFIAPVGAEADKPAAEQTACEAAAPVESDEAVVRLLCGEETIDLQAADYLTSVLLCEMPSSFELEALKAQAVAARTFLWKQAAGGKHENADLCADSACCQAWRGEEELRETFGDGFDAAWEKAARAVYETKDEVLVYDGALIDATYFSCAGGNTEAAIAVWGTDVPYLQSVSSPDEDALRARSEAEFSLSEFRSIIEAADSTADLSGESSSWLGGVTRTEGGGVDEMQIGGSTFKGIQLRKLFNLRSTCFTLELTEDTAVFHVRGYGHRVGMSQYGAQHLAQSGFSYRVILQYYYQNTRIKKLSREGSGQYALSN